MAESLRARVQLSVDVSSLRHWEGDLKAARQAMKDQVFEAGRTLGPSIRSEAISKASGVSRQAAKAAEPSIRVKYNKASTQIVLSSATIPFAFGAEYGSVRFKQFKPWRGNAAGAGYFLWPSIRNQLGTYNRAIDRKVDDIMKGPFSG